MPTVTLTFKKRTRSRQFEQARLEALERLHAHYAAVDDAIRALEQYQRMGPSRALAVYAALRKCS